MARKGYASTDQVMQAFKGDSKIEEQLTVWPNTAVGRVALIAQAHRPADRILGLAWELHEFDKDEFRKTVYAVWSKKTTDPIHSWTFGEMFDYIDANPTWVPQPFDPKKWAAVQSWRPGMRFSPPSKLGPLIAYFYCASSINDCRIESYGKSRLGIYPFVQNSSFVQNSRNPWNLGQPPKPNKNTYSEQIAMHLVIIERNP